MVDANCKGESDFQKGQTVESYGMRSTKSVVTLSYSLAVNIDAAWFSLMKEIRLSQHAELKLKILANHGMTVPTEFVADTIHSPDSVEEAEDNKLIAQKRLDESRVLRVVYREFKAFVVVITLYPGRRSRYEKN